MGDSSPLSFRVDDEIITALDDAIAEQPVSRSQFAREALLRGLEALTDEDGNVHVPEWLGHDARVRRMIASNKATRREGKFRSEFSKQLRRSFENNETPAEFRNSVAGYIEESEELGELPEDVREHADTDARTYREWVGEMLEYYRVAYQSQNFDHDPIDNPLGNHEGIDNAREWITRAENIANETDKSRRRQLAVFALQDGLVPDHIEQQAEQSELPEADAVVRAAEEQTARPALDDEGGDDSPALDS